MITQISLYNKVTNPDSTLRIPLDIFLERIRDGDGWLNRGGGFIQLTGAEIWKLYSRYCSIPVPALATLVRANDDYAFDSACWYFSVHASLNSLALQDAFETITRRVNGGLNGYQDRLDYYNRAKGVLPIAT